MNTTYGGKHDQSEFIYPVMNNEIRVAANPEIIVQGGNHFFSPTFKHSSIILEGVLRKYQKKKKFLNKFIGDNRMCVRLDFDRKIDEEIILIIEQLKKNYKQITRKRLELGHTDILAFFRSAKNTFLLTADTLYSASIYDGKQCFQRKLSDIGWMDSYHIYALNGEIISICDSDFSDDFFSLFNELIELNKDVKLPYGKHPMLQEKQNGKEGYLSIMVYKIYANGGLSAKEIIRLETLAKHLGVSSRTILDLLLRAKKEYENETEEHYIQIALEENLDLIQHKYNSVLLHDLLIFDLISSGQRMEHEMSLFTEQFIQRRNLNKEFAKKYQDILQAFVSDAYAIYDMMKIYGNETAFENDQMLENTVKLIQFEYAMEANLIGGNQI